MAMMLNTKSATQAAQNPLVAATISAGLSAVTGGAISIPPEQIIRGAKAAEAIEKKLEKKSSQNQQQESGNKIGKGPG